MPLMLLHQITNLLPPHQHALQCPWMADSALLSLPLKPQGRTQQTQDCRNLMSLQTDQTLPQLPWLASSSESATCLPQTSIGHVPSAACFCAGRLSIPWPHVVVMPATVMSASSVPRFFLANQMLTALLSQHWRTPGGRQCPSPQRGRPRAPRSRRRHCRRYQRWAWI